MKTLVMFENIVGESVFFCELEGDYSHLDGVYIGMVEHEAAQRVLHDLVFDSEGNFIVEELRAPTKDWDHFIKVGQI